MDAIDRMSPHAGLEQLINEVRANTLQLAALFAVPTTLGFLVLAAIDLDVRRRPEMWLIIGSIVGTSVLVHRLAREQSCFASVIFVGGMLVSILIVLVVFPGTPLIYALALVSLAAGIFFSGPACAGVSAAVLALAMALVLQPEGPWNSSDAAPLLLLISGSAALAWLGNRPAEVALDWYDSSYQQARETAKMLRQHRAELVRLSQQLTLTVNHLEEANYQLDRARREAEAARQLKNEFATAISHELRTPLNLVIGYSEMLIRATRSGLALAPAQLSGDVEAIYRNAGHISDLINDVLDLSRIEAHRFALQKQPVSLSSIVEEAVEAVRGLFDAAAIDLRTSLPSDLPTVNADPVRVRQVLINLLGNAARHTEEGTVEVRGWRDGNQITIEVHDTGVGIAPEDLPWIFEEFRQSGDPRRRRGGSGVGLTVSRYFVEMHGGNMWVTSTPGVGSTFHFTLPLQAQVLAQTATRGGPGRSGAPGSHRDRILVRTSPEGEPFRLFRSYLDGYDVAAIADLGAAGQIAEAAGAVALVLPEAPQPSELARIASESAALAALPMITCPLRVPARLGDPGIADYLVKPVRRDSLVAGIRRAAGRPRAVLVVDDDSDLRELLVRTIRQEFKRCRVLEAEDGVSALQLMRSARPDVVLLDLLMPRSDGYDVLAARRADPDLVTIPIVGISARGLEDETITAASLTVGRSRGLTVAEVMRLTSACLEALLTPPGNSDQAPPTTPAG